MFTLNNFSLILAVRYFRAKKNEKFVSIISAISLAGITLGVAALIIVMSVMNGFHIELVSNIVGLNGDITITPSRERTIEDYDKVINILKSHQFVREITPIISGQALAIGITANSGVMIKAMDASNLANKGQILQNVLEGTFSDYHGDNSIAIGSGLARNLGLYVGAKVKMISPNLISTAFGSMPRSKDFTVIAIFNSGMYDYDLATVLMPIQAAKKFLSIDGFNLLEINLADSTMAKYQARILHQELGLDLNISSWMHNNQQFLKALEIERVAMFAILSLIIIVAAFNIISSLFMLVKDKTKDIAILRTIGASTRQIMNIFIINGMMIGTIGTSLGVALGLSISYNIENIRKMLEKFSGTTIFDPAIYFLYTLPSVVQIADVIQIGGLSILLCFLATIYPAYKASALSPIEAMRYE